MTDHLVPRMTVGDVNMIHSWFHQGLSTGVVTGIDVFQEEAGDLVSLLGGNGMPVMGFGRNRWGFFLVDHCGDLIQADPMLEALLKLAEHILPEPPSGH